MIMGTTLVTVEPGTPAPFVPLWQETSSIVDLGRQKAQLLRPNPALTALIEAKQSIFGLDSSSGGLSVTR